jgi:hypothetical protein
MALMGRLMGSWLNELMVGGGNFQRWDLEAGSEVTGGVVWKGRLMDSYSLDSWEGVEPVRSRA